MKSQRKPIRSAVSVLIGLCLWALIPLPTVAQGQRDDDDHPSFVNRRDIRHLPKPLKDRLVELADRPHSFLPTQAFNEADKPSQLFQYYLLDTTGFEPNVFTTIVPGINDGTKPTATGPNGQLPTIGSVRVVLEPKAGLPTNPEDVRAAIDVFTDISGLFVINNESGWYEGWMIHDLKVPEIARPRRDGHAQFGTMTAGDAEELAEMGTHNNVPGHFFTVNGKAIQLPSENDHFPDKQTNVEEMAGYVI